MHTSGLQMDGVFAWEKIRPVCGRKIDRQRDVCACCELQIKAGGEDVWIQGGVRIGGVLLSARFGCESKKAAIR